MKFFFCQCVRISALWSAGAMNQNYEQMSAVYNLKQFLQCVWETTKQPRATEQETIWIDVAETARF